jgi:DNA-binding MarR family transcriptional regulator
MTKDAAGTDITGTDASTGTGTSADGATGTGATDTTDTTDVNATNTYATDEAGTDTPAPATGATAPDRATAETTARVWRGMAALVLEQSRDRKELVETFGMSFFRIKALRRIAARPSRMSELATRLGTDRPYLSLVVDDLVKRGLVERHQHPTDRRSKIVKATPEGLAVADRANAIMGTPPPQLAALPPEDLAALDRILTSLGAQG